MSYTRSRGGTSTTAHPQRIQIQPGTSTEEDGIVKCTGHQRRCVERVAGPSSKNPGRAFYACPVPMNDPSKCKFFKWKDELHASPRKSQPTDSRAARLAAATNGQTLGQSPVAQYGKPVSTPTANRLAPITPQSAPGGFVTGNDEDEIDWEQVDTENLEAVAIASTPGSSQKAETPKPSFADRLRDVGDESLGKRKREEDEGLTPKRSLGKTESNPFISSPSQPLSPPHAVLSPTLSSLENLSEHLHRQDRLIKAGETAKEGFRKTIRTLQDRNKELEDKVNELEARLRIK